MDSQSSYTYDDLPWQLIVPALHGELSPEESGPFEEWLAASPVNREKYQRLLHIWREGIADYTVYAQADEKQAWEALRGQLAMGGTTHRSPAAPVIHADFKERSSG